MARCSEESVGCNEYDNAVRDCPILALHAEHKKSEMGKLTPRI